MESVDAIELLSGFGVEKLYHITPLHYFPFIARSEALLSRSELKAAGYPDSHFRRTSHRADAARGFGDRIYFSPLQSPPILLAKLGRGFPHLRLEVPLVSFADVSFDLCRFAVARTWYLRRDGKPGPEPSASNGKYYGTRQLPVARTFEDMRAMLDKHLRKGDPIEVQVRDRLLLPKDTCVTCFSSVDLSTLQLVARQIDIKWSLKLANEQAYSADRTHQTMVAQFVRDALADCNWRGNGLDFDRLL